MDMEKQLNIADMLRSGSTYSEIKQALHVSPVTINRVVRAMKDAGESIPKTRRGPEPLHDRLAIKAAYESGLTYSDLKEIYGCSQPWLTRQARSGLFEPRPSDYRLPNKRIGALEYIDQAQGKRHSRARVRLKVLEEDLVEYVCAICANPGDWLGHPMVLRLDHINGDGRDHSIENLRFLCPNCDSQQPTYGHKNRGRYDGDVGRQENALVCETS